MRILLLVALATLTTPALAQRVFKATDLSSFQNQRLDDLEFKIGEVDTAVKTLTKEFRTHASKTEQTLRELKEEKVLPVSLPEEPEPRVVRQPTIQPGYLTTGELRALIQQHRPNGWSGPVYADVQPRTMVYQHLVDGNHGFRPEQVNGLSLPEALILHDLAPNHGNKIFPQRTSQSVPTVRVEPANSMMKVQSLGVGCANGQCARSSSSRSRFRLFGR